MVLYYQEQDKDMAKNSAARIKSNAKYDAANTVQVHLKLNKKTDKDVIDKLDTVPSKQTYLKNLVREDLKRQGE